VVLQAEPSQRGGGGTRFAVSDHQRPERGVWKSVKDRRGGKLRKMHKKRNCSREPRKKKRITEERSEKWINELRKEERESGSGGTSSLRIPRGLARELQLENVR